MAEKEVTFKGKVVRCVCDMESFKVYAMKVSKQKYPMIKQNKYSNVSINGDLPLLAMDVEYEINAIEESGKYGYGYKVKSIRRDVPTSEEGVKIFLQEVLTPQQAETLYSVYPDIMDRVKDKRLDDIDLDKLPGIGEVRLDGIVRKIEESFYLADLVAEFKGVLTLSMLNKIHAKYSSIETLRKKLKKEPYKTLTRVSGIGFKTADAIVLELQDRKIVNFGYDVRTSCDRCLACMLYFLEESKKDGHTKMNLAELRRQCIDMVPACADHFPEALQDEDIYYNKEKMEIALASSYATEKYIANVITKNLDNNNNIWEYDIEKYRNVGEFVLSDEQIQVLDSVCKNPISILNGNAGSGKSLSTMAITRMLDDHYKSYTLLSPTGKAAKVLADVTGKEARTIHRGLEYIPGGFGYNEKNKLRCDVVIVDEMSMVDIFLFKSLLEAIDFNRTKLLMIGDNAQLPSVGCGNLLHDFMQSCIIPTVSLTKVFRYNEGGMSKIATDVRNCKPYLNKSVQDKVTSFGNNSDYVFIDADPEIIPKKVVQIYKKLLESGNDVANIQVLTCKNKGKTGCIELNNMLQRVANKNYGSEIFIKVGDTNFYVGDFVMQTKNNYGAPLSKDGATQEELVCWFDDDDEKKIPTAFVANGETGVIKEICKGKAVIDFGGVLVEYSRDNMNEVSLGYAITCHKSQGSSIDNVIVLTTSSDIFMLNSNILYVGLTRMRKRCYHLGQWDTVNKAVKKKANLTRHTFMKDLLIERYDKYTNNVNNVNVLEQTEN